MSRLFGGISMTWPKVIVFALLAGAYTGLINQVPALKDTSFQDIAALPEIWVFFGMVIAVNCDGWLEAGLKCLVFFLISQPVVYLVEIPTIGFELGMSYWTTTWLPRSFLTFPAGIIAWLTKRQDALGASLLGLVNMVIAITGIHYVVDPFSKFPHPSLSVVLCVAMVAALVTGVQKRGRNRVISLAVTGVIVSVLVVYVVSNGLVL